MLEAWKSVGALVGQHKDNLEPETKVILEFQVHEKWFYQKKVRQISDGFGAKKLVINTKAKTSVSNHFPLCLSSRQTSNLCLIFN